MNNEFNTTNFEEEVLKADVPVLVDMFATWCGPCKMLSPIIEGLVSQYEGKAKIGKVDTDQNPDLAIKYGVQFLPTILLFKNGEVVNKLIGLQDEATLKEELDKLI